MIAFENGAFWLDTPTTTYVFRPTAFGHLEHVYYGPRLSRQPVDALAMKRAIEVGSSVEYDPSDPTYCLDQLCLEWSGTGRGDYRHSPIEVKTPIGFSTDFLYTSHRIVQGDMPMEGLPCARAEHAESLQITLRDEAAALELEIVYTLFEGIDVIARRAVLRNKGDAEASLRRMMSLSLDISNRNYKLITFDGAWIKEAHRHDRTLMPGMFVNSSTTGASSNRHNPGFLLAAQETTEDSGEALGFNLLYSGNHFSCAELSPFGLVRIQTGLNPHCFEWMLAPGESFETPQAVMAYSSNGLNGLSQCFHTFVNQAVVPTQWQSKDRPVLYNNWEACFFKFNQRKLLKMARIAKRLGIETFVLDDGWFGARNSDHAGLGDYDVNRRKLPRGLDALAKRINRLGMDFGLWVEPEMVNPDSNLFRLHPDWALTTPGRTPTLGRHQLVLDLCRQEVRDYLVDSISRVLDGANIRYVKWDMNRHISDAFSPVLPQQGVFYHRYVLGLYEILGRIFGPRPHILLETCSSGGNRFDLGILCYGPQIWASDCTDPIERLDIQGGLSYLYPPSTWGAHVSDAPHQQTLRDTPLSTRFHVAAFGSLGYELDLRFLSKVERGEIQKQIAYYKQHRQALQFGRFQRVPTAHPGRVQWQSNATDGSKALSGRFQTRTEAAPTPDILQVKGLNPKAFYRLSARPQALPIKRFGGLIKHVLPFALRPDGMLLTLANRYFAMKDGVEAYETDGQALEVGLPLNQQFMGTGYNESLRMLGDFGSTLYLVERLEV